MIFTHLKNISIKKMKMRFLNGLKNVFMSYWPIIELAIEES